MTHDLTFAFVIGLILGVVVVGGIAAPLALEAGRDQIRLEATQSGAAAWQCDPQTGEREFVWRGAIAQ